MHVLRSATHRCILRGYKSIPVVLHEEDENIETILSFFLISTGPSYIAQEKGKERGEEWVKFAGRNDREKSMFDRRDDYTTYS
jgi:hypothetical protein